MFWGGFWESCTEFEDPGVDFGVLEELKCSFASSVLGFLHKLPDFGPSGVGTKCPCSTSPTVSQQHLAKKSPLCLWRTRQELAGLSTEQGCVIRDFRLEIPHL